MDQTRFDPARKPVISLAAALAERDCHAMRVRNRNLRTQQRAISQCRNRLYLPFPKLIYKSKRPQKRLNN